MKTLDEVSVKPHRFSRGLNPLPYYGILEALDGRTPPERLFNAALALWGDAGQTPAMWDYVERAWRPASQLTPRIGIMAHLLGEAYIGIYPFRGVVRGCGCPRGTHTCLGRCCNYFLLDLDGHKGEGDVGALATRLAVSIRAHGLQPLTFTSRSGTGLHFYVFLDALVPTSEAFAVGVRIRAHAGVPGARCDVIPSAGHGRGLGTQAALPLSPRAAEQGGGLLLDDQLRPVTDRAEIIGRLEWADTFRNSAAIIRQLARPSVGSTATAVDPTSNTAVPTARKPKRRKKTTAKKAAKLSIGGKSVVAAMSEAHPQFKRALAVPASAWKGGRSSKDAYLAAFMRRQGVDPKVQASALEQVSGSKASDRGRVYTLPLAQWAHPNPVELDLTASYAGTRIAYTRRLKEIQTSSSTMTGVDAPWSDRVAPPLSYGPIQKNPWWLDDVQERLRAPRVPKTDAVVLAYVIDVWFRGPFQGRAYYASNRMIAEALDLSPSTVHGVLVRLRARFSDVVHVERGVPHAILRIANAFAVVGAPSQDAIEILSHPGQDSQARLSLTTDEAPDAGSAEDGMVRNEAAGERTPVGDAGVRPRDGSAGVPADVRGVERGADADPTDRRWSATYLLLRASGLVAACAARLPNESRRDAAGLGDPRCGGRPVRRVYAPARRPCDSDLWYPTLSARATRLHRQHGAGGTGKRSRRTLPRSDPFG